MKIRTITCFYNPNHPDSAKTLATFTQMLDHARKRFDAAGFEVQTVRLATTPFSQWGVPIQVDALLSIIKPLEQSIKEQGYGYVSFGHASPDCAGSYAVIPALLQATDIVFFSGIIASRNHVFLKAVHQTGEIIAKAAQITPDGFTNLRFTALANVQPDGPFFPAAYHLGDEPAFSLALESADLAITAFERADSLENARELLLKAIEQNASQLNLLAEELSAQYGVTFKGMDFSLAPYPVDTCSLGGSIEKLGVEQIGLSGSLASAAFVADALDRGSWKKAGFNGLMLPLLEDSILAQRSIEGSLTLRDLLLYSAVCGTGLDTVPLPGDASAEQLSAVLLDIAALSSRLDKPLTARLMPVPGKSAGELTTFDFEFFKNGRILELPAKPLTRLLQGCETFELRPRHK